MSLAFIPEVIFIFKILSQKKYSPTLPKITLRANAVIFIIGTILLSIAVLYDVNYLNYKAPISYSNWQEIVWSDFRAIKRPKQTLDGNQNFAFINSEMRITQEDNAITVNTLFHPARSYTFSKESAGRELLQHELYHLHITEYWSRIARKKISESDHKPEKLQLKEIVEEVRIKESKMQKKYDEESYHGYLLGKQKIWQHKIDSSLHALEHFSKPTIDFN